MGQTSRISDIRSVQKGKKKEEGEKWKDPDVREGMLLAWFQTSEVMEREKELPEISGE